MSDYAGLEKLTPSIIRYPFKKVINAFINIKLGRRIVYSIFTILAGLLGLAIGYIFPGIGAFTSFLLNLFMETRVNSAVLTGVSMVVSMLLVASLLIYVTRDIFKSYYINKYGISNPELRFTLQDREILTIQYTEDGFTPDEIKEKLNELELRIEFLLDKIRFFKMTGEDDKKKTAKYALHDLKRGDMSVFYDLYEDLFIKKQQRLEKLRKKPQDASSKETVAEARATRVDTSAYDEYDEDDYDYQDYDAASDTGAVSAVAAEEKSKVTTGRTKTDRNANEVLMRDSQNNTVSLVVNLYGGATKEQVQIERSDAKPILARSDSKEQSEIAENDDDDTRFLISSPS